MSSTPRARLDDLVGDLRRQQDALDGLVVGISADGWRADSAAPGWSVQDQLLHISCFDQVAVQVMADPEAFVAARAAILADPDRYMREHLDPGRAQKPEVVLGDWRRNRTAMLAAFTATDPQMRHPWFGPDMNTVSFATARLMEIFAHGQDIADGLGGTVDNNAGLLHIAHLGVITRGYAYVANGRPTPDAEIRVDLEAADGARRTWGPPDAAESVVGSARDFCLVVTQRRHVADTALALEGAHAREWMAIAQAFAGKPGAGRKPGQFSGTAAQ